MSSEQLFDTWPEKYRQWFQTPIGRFVMECERRWVMEFLLPQPGERILDAGCGSGLFTAPIIEAGAGVLGLDVSEPMLRYACEALSDERFYPVLGSMLQLPFGDGAFDKTVSITALEFVEEAQQAVDELFRVTRPGGCVVVATLNRLSPWAERRSANARRDETSVFRHTFFRGPDELRALTHRSGVVKTAVHFPKDAKVSEARALEREGEAAACDRGAFAIGRWLK